jgi:predicted dehydrogenase (TIGR03970 family)
VADWDVVVVGAGSAGCALAARLADAGRRVLVLEAGRDHVATDDFPPVLRDASVLGAAVPGHPANWDLPGVLTDGVTRRVPRGRVVGGSSAVNGGYFVRGTRGDFDGWAAVGNDLWSYEQVLPAFGRLEDDRDFGDRPGHGTGGPVPVSRPTAGHPLVDAFAAATEALGFPAEPDKNGDGAPGFGPIPCNVRDGVRVNAAMAYLTPRRGLPGLTVRGDTLVRRVVVEHGRAVGVATADGIVRAAEVVLSAGAVGSPHLLLLSGIGPADRLRAAGVDVVADVPGVGAEFTDHPTVHVSYRLGRELPASGHRLPLHSALNTADDLELLPWLRPFSAVLLDPAAGDDLPLGVGLQQEESRGRLTLVSGDPAVPPLIEYRYLGTDADRRAMRRGVRLAVELLRSPAMARWAPIRTDLPDDVLADDRLLDGWVRQHLGSAVHLSGTARMGPAADAGAVVDQHLRVRGVEGLRVVDTSVLPRVTSRGPAATAVMVGERAAELALTG